MTGDEPRAPGRPRSEAARRAVLEAVDNLLVNAGYGAMTMKGIAEAAGVGRQTVYRWWSTKAEILLEACVIDAADALRPPLLPQNVDEVGDYLFAYLDSVESFLHDSDAGAGYLALLGEAQHDADVSRLLGEMDPVVTSAGLIVSPLSNFLDQIPSHEVAAGQLLGPSMLRALTREPRLPKHHLRAHVETLLRAW